MKLFKKTIASLCALALLLSLAPCAFAETITENQDEIGWVEKEGDTTVNNGVTVTVTDDPEGSDSGFVAGGTLTNNGTVDVKGEDSNAVVGGRDKLINNGTITTDSNGLVAVGDNKYLSRSDVSGVKGLENNGTITSTGENYAYVSAGQIVYDENGDFDHIESGSITNNNTIKVDGELVSSVRATGDLTNNKDITVDGGTGSANVVAGYYENGDEDGDDVPGEALTVGSIKNSGTITLKGHDTFVDATGDLTNGGTIDMDATEDAMVYTEGNLDNSATITGKGKYTSVGATGNLTNSGTIDMDATEDAMVYTEGNLDNSATITGNAAGVAGVIAEGDLKNTGNITLGDPEGVSPQVAGVVAVGDLNNENTITLESTDVSIINVFGDVKNSGTMTVNSEKQALIEAHSSLTNENEIKISGPGNKFDPNGLIVYEDLINKGEINMNGGDGALKLDVGGEVQNYGKLSMLAEGGVSFAEAAESIVNYGTITLQEALPDSGTKINNYYGFNLENADGSLTSLLSDGWQSGIEGTEINDYTMDAALSKSGYTFGGWKMNGTVYQPGDVVSFKLSGATTIQAIWNKIIAAVSDSGGESGEYKEPAGARELIVEHLDLKVLDETRREMEKVTEYHAVARTSYNRLVVLFTWQQMQDMEKGDHLYYIVMPDGTEVEYTLTIR